MKERINSYMLDVNGNEIYEGDYLCKIDDEVEMGKVFYSKEEGMFIY